MGAEKKEQGGEKPALSVRKDSERESPTKDKESFSQSSLLSSPGSLSSPVSNIRKESKDDALFTPSSSPSTLPRPSSSPHRPSISLSPSNGKNPLDTLNRLQAEILNGEKTIKEKHKANQKKDIKTLQQKIQEIEKVIRELLEKEKQLKKGQNMKEMKEAGQITEKLEHFQVGERASVWV